MDNHLTRELTNGILVLTLNRPESLNAFSPEMITGLTEEVEQAKTDEEVKVIVLKGAGRAFSAGGDVKGMGKSSATLVYEHIGRLNKCIMAIKTLEKPVVAVVHGFAAGAGFNLALACDLILAAEDSKFILSFSKVGLISDGGGLYFLPHVLGPYRAKELLFSAKPLEAKKAHEWGIVNEVVPLEQLEAAGIAYAQQLANGPTKAIGLMKKLADQALTQSLYEVLEQERITQTMMVSTEDHLEGVTAFKEKRQPEFKGK